MGTTDQTLTAVRDALAPLVAGLGLDLYDVELNGSGAARTLRITVEREGGVDLDAITDVTRAVSPVLDHSSETFIVVCDPVHHVLGYSAPHLFRESAHLLCACTPTGSNGAD